MDVVESGMWVGAPNLGRRLKHVETCARATDSEQSGATIAINGFFSDSSSRPNRLCVVTVLPSERLDYSEAYERINDWVVDENARQQVSDEVSEVEKHKLTQARAARSSLMQLGESARMYRGWKRRFEIEAVSTAGPENLVPDAVRFLSEIEEVVMMASGVDVMPCTEANTATVDVNANAHVRDTFTAELEGLGLEGRLDLRCSTLVRVSWDLYRFGLLKLATPAYTNAPTQLADFIEHAPQFKSVDTSWTTINSPTI